MKLYKSILAMLAVAATSGAFVSCDDDLDRPPVIVPVATYEVNTSMAEFKEMFWQAAQTNTPQTIPVNAAGDSIILGGRIISSDEYGNVYQHIYVRDESGAMDFRIYGYDLYESYHIGQEVRINVTGLLVGGYGTQMQIGVWYTNPNTGSTSLGGMDVDEFKLRAQRNGLPTAQDAEPYTVTLSDLASWINDKEKQVAWQCQLVRIENVSFEGGGELGWCQNPGQTGSTNRTLKDAAGNTITVRTSDKCKFSSQILPKGTGTVIALLGYYKSNSGSASWQLTVMDPQSGCVDGFEFVDKPEIPTPDPSEAVSSLNVTFPDKSMPSDWNLVKVSGDKAWYAAEFNGDCYAACTGYKGTNPPFDAWMISPAIDMAKVTDKNLTFDNQVNGYGSTTTQFEVYVLDSPDPSAATKTKLNPTLAVAPESGYSGWVNSGALDLSSFTGIVYIGFRFYATADANYATWCVDNIKLNAGETPDTPVTPPTGGFSETFANGQGEFTIENVSMSPDLTYVWKYDDTNKYMKASAYIGGAKASDSYLISPVIDLAGLDAPVLSFDQIINKFPSVDVAKQQISVCARLEGSSDWTKLEMTEFGTNSGWNWIESGNISLASFAGKKIQIAFHYTSTDSESGTWEVKNVTVK